MFYFGIDFLGNAHKSFLFFKIVTNFSSRIGFVSQYHFVFEIKSLQEWQGKKVVINVSGKKQKFNNSKIFIDKEMNFSGFTYARRINILLCFMPLCVLARLQ